MPLKDEADYTKETAADLRSRVVSYQFFAQVILKGYDALRSHGVDFKSLPEWKDDADLDLANKMKPQKASEIVVAWLTRLDNAISAAVRRKSFGVHKGGNPTSTEPKH